MDVDRLRTTFLAETIFEFRWRLSASHPFEVEEDSYYPFLVGRFFAEIEEDYPFREPLPASRAPSALVPYLVQHRFRISKDNWPLIQIGPGILTVNTTKGHEWEDFSKRCVSAVEIISSLHPANDTFDTQNMMLRYICANASKQSKESIFGFLENTLGIKVNLPSILFENTQVDTNPSDFDWSMSFPTSESTSVISLRFGMGESEGAPANVWEIATQTSRFSAPPPPAACSEWLGKAHDLTDDWFLKLLESELKVRCSDEL